MKKTAVPRSGFIIVTLLIALAFSVACGGGAGGGSTPPAGPPPPATSIALTPNSVTLHGGDTQQFTATVTGLADASVTWSVNGVVGGNASLGTVNTTGLYQAPEIIPSPNPVKVQVTSVAKQSLKADSSVKVTTPLPVITSITPNNVQTPAVFTLTVTGRNFVNGSVILWSAIHLPTTLVSTTQLTASVTQSLVTSAVGVRVLNPDSANDISNLMYVQCDPASVLTPALAARFLQQSTWGPNREMMTNIQLVGRERFLEGQFSTPMTVFTPPAENFGLPQMKEIFFNYGLMRQDQLRQRVAFALSQIMVASSNKVSDASAWTLWQNMMQRDAFGNYYDLLKDVTLSPVMGNYLDMVNNDKPNPARGTSPNENYAREVLQLFSIGLNQLNPDGTLQLDGSGNPIPTYSQETIEGFAHAFTGWTYPPAGGSPTWNSSPNYSGPMVPIDSHHDTGAKELLNGVVLPAGGTTQADMDAALQNIFNHPNVGPFICKQLIQHLVTSNPSPDYISRVVGVFNNNGSGVRGDLKAVISAILLDSEARRGDDPAQVQANDGHLKEPLLFMLNLLRAMNMVANGDGLPKYAVNMKQEPLNPPSVFNYYHPGFVISGTNQLGPEFEIFNTSTAISRINYVYDAVYGKIGAETTTDLSDYTAVASTPDQLVDKVATFLLHGQISPEARTAVIAAVSSISDNNRRVKAALYLIASSSQFQVEH